MTFGTSAVMSSGVTLERTRRRVLDVVSSASHAVQRQQCLTHGWVELRADRVVNGEISSAAGGAQALIIQDCGQRLPCTS